MRTGAVVTLAAAVLLLVGCGTVRYLPDGNRVTLHNVRERSGRTYADWTGSPINWPSGQLRESRPEGPGYKGTGLLVTDKGKIAVLVLTDGPKRLQSQELQSFDELVAYCDRNASLENPLYIHTVRSSKWDQAMREDFQKAWDRTSRKECIFLSAGEAGGGGWVPK